MPPGVQQHDESSTTEAELLSRLQSQFGDMDLNVLFSEDDEKKRNDGTTGIDSEESSEVVDPTPEELEEWQAAQFQKGENTLQQKKLIDMPAAQRRRVDAGQEDDDWEVLGALPTLTAESSFFPEYDASGNAILGVHPLLQALSRSDPEILGGAWRRMYSSALGDGLSFHRLLDTLKGYRGPTVLFIKANPSESHSISIHSAQNNRTAPESNPSISSSILGFYTTSPWTESPSFYGSEDCSLFTMDPEENEVQFLRPIKEKSGSAKNYMYCHPSSLNLSNRRSSHNASASNRTDGLVHGIAVGGSPSQPRLHLTETLEDCRAMDYCSTFEPGPLLKNGSDSLYYFDADSIEVWGVGGDDWISKSLQAQQKDRDLAEAVLKRARKVDKKQFFDDLKFLGTGKHGFFEHMEHVADRTDI